MYEKSCASSNHIKSWKDIDFGTAEYEVKKLQMRIAKAVKENRVGKDVYKRQALNVILSN